MATKNIDSVVQFQEWYNKTFGQPKIATDGDLSSVGTQEAYAKHGNDFIEYLKDENKKVVDSLNVALNKEKTARVAAEYLSVNSKQEIDKAIKNGKKKAIVLGVGGLLLGAVIVGLFKVSGK